jgi:adenine-specific DNA-methyltransferase
MQQISLLPSANELPSHYAERLSRYYSINTNQEHKKELGQFFTPLVLSNFIASFSGLKKKKVKILDPGCGTCILSCSLVEKISENKRIETIELTTYEIDPKLNVHTAASLSYLNDWLLKKNIALKINHRSIDFINENLDAIDLESKQKHDIIISNPPYFKISKQDDRKKLFKTISNGQVNIYAVFAAISANMLANNGELIFIIPRSFASGEYFKKFRQIFFSKVQIENVHLFISRKDAFAENNVLQESVIIKGKKLKKINRSKKIKISQSLGIEDINLCKPKEFLYTKIIDLGSEEKFLYLPNSNEQEEAIQLIKEQTNNLDSLGYKVSTGPIVYFRKTQFLQKEKEDDSVPLYWLDNVKKYSITHPMNGKSREQFFKHTKKSISVLVNNSTLILVRRFSSKDDSSRLVAAIHSKRTQPEYEKIGIENKLNYINKKEGKLGTYEAMGICAILNSSVYDEYFKTFNGNTQVSASELKKIPLPKISQIEAIGKKVSRLDKKGHEKINDIVVKSLLKIKT